MNSELLFCYVPATERIVPVLAIFAQNLALYNKNNRVLLSQALCVIVSLGNLTFVVNIKFPRATNHMIVPSREELYCLNRNYFELKI